MTTAFSTINRPDSYTYGQNVNYTVPEGKIARVSLWATVNVGHIHTNSSTSNQTFSHSNATDSQEASVILESGDILSSTRTAASGSTTINANSNTSRNQVSTVDILVNANICLSITARGSSVVCNDSAGTGSITSSGTAEMGFIAEEYYG